MKRPGPRDPLQTLVDFLAITAGALLVATLAAEALWRQVRPKNLEVTQRDPRMTPFPRRSVLEALRAGFGRAS